MKKRFLSVVLCLCMVVGMLPTITPMAQASGTGVADNLNRLRSQYPANQYWYRVNGVNSVTTAPCPHYSNLSVCGAYNGGWQCWAFASWIFNEVFHQAPNTGNGKNYDKSQIKVGDYVRFTVPWNADFGNSLGHSFVVLSKNGNTVRVVENNAGGNCKIRWDHEYDLNSPIEITAWVGNSLKTYYANFDYFCRATNYDEVNGATPSQPTAPAQYIGQDFYAYIYNDCSRCHLENRNDNIQTASQSQYDPRQIWFFAFDESRRWGDFARTT